MILARDTCLRPAQSRSRTATPFVLFTDGVTEARNRDDEEFGEESSRGVPIRNHGAAPADMLRDVFVAVHAFCAAAEPTDDITVTVTPAGS